MAILRVLFVALLTLCIHYTATACPANDLLGTPWVSQYTEISFTNPTTGAPCKVIVGYCYRTRFLGNMPELWIETVDNPPCAAGMDWFNNGSHKQLLINALLATDVNLYNLVAYGGYGFGAFPPCNPTNPSNYDFVYLTVKTSDCFKLLQYFTQFENSIVPDPVLRQAACTDEAGCEELFGFCLDYSYTPAKLNIIRTTVTRLLPTGGCPGGPMIIPVFETTNWIQGYVVQPCTAVGCQ